MRLRRRPAPQLFLVLLAACGGTQRPLGTIEPVPGSRTREGREIVPLDSVVSRQIKPLNGIGREIVPLDSGRTIRRLGDTTVIIGREIAPVETEVVPVDGTLWRGSNYEGELILEFLIGGILRYTAPSGTWSNGTWHQDGNGITFEMNSHWSDYSGRIRGTRMTGTGYNRAGRTWDWQATRQ